MVSLIYVINFDILDDTLREFYLALDTNLYFSEFAQLGGENLRAYLFQVIYHFCQDIWHILNFHYLHRFI